MGRRRNNVQGKPCLFFVAFAWLTCSLSLGCHSGPAFTDDTAYRTIERDAQRVETELAITGTDIAAGVERIDSRAERVKSELDSLGAAIGGSDLGDAEKSALLRQVAVAQEETAALRGEADTLRTDTMRLNEQLVEQRQINAALSAEHNRREAAAAAVRIELADTKEELAGAKGQRNLYLAILIAICIGVLAYIAFRVLRLFRVIPV
jgi:chromosome segregation ATPase